MSTRMAIGQRFGVSEERWAHSRYKHRRGHQLKGQCPEQGSQEWEWATEAPNRQTPVGQLPRRDRTYVANHLPHRVLGESSEGIVASVFSVARQTHCPPTKMHIAHLRESRPFKRELFSRS